MTNPSAYYFTLGHLPFRRGAFRSSSRDAVSDPHTVSCTCRFAALAGAVFPQALLLILLAPVINLRAAQEGSVSGRVADPEGNAVAHATVQLTDASGTVACRSVTNDEGNFVCRVVDSGRLVLTVENPQFLPIKASVWVVTGRATHVDLQFHEVVPQRQSVTVVAQAPPALTPDPSERIVIHNQVLDANPGRPGAPISIPGLPVETASGGIKAPQYFAPGVAGDHGEPIAQYLQIGNFLFPNNLPANAHGNGYADPNFLIPAVIDAVAIDGGAFNVREGNNAVDLAASYEPKSRLTSFMQLTGDDHDFDVVTGWSPTNRATKGWIALEGSFGNGFLKRPEHRQQYKLNISREIKTGKHDLTLFGVGYYGSSWIPGLIPVDVRVPGDTIDNRQLDHTHTSIFVASDDWQMAPSRHFLFSGYFRTYSLKLRSDFGDGLIQQGEFRTVAGGEAAYLQKVRPWVSLLAGIDLRRDAPRGLDLKHLDRQQNFQFVTSNDLTFAFAEPFAALDGVLGSHFHYDLGIRREEVNVDNQDRIEPGHSFNKLTALTLPKATLSVLAPDGTPLPSASFSYGEAFHTNDPRIGSGTTEGTLVATSRAFQMALTKEAVSTDFKIKLVRVVNSQELAKIDPDTGLQENVGPSLIRAITFSAHRYFPWGSLYASFARANAQNRLTGEDIPEAPRLIWDAEGSIDRLPFGLRARGEVEYVGRKPLGDGFTAIPVREIRGAVLRSFGHGRMSLGVNFLLGSGFTGQTLETLALAGETAPFERIVGVPLKSYVSLTWVYRFHSPHLANKL